MWELWGNRMLKVWAKGEASKNRLAPHKPISAQLEVYVSRDLSSITHVGKITNVGDVAGNLDDHTPSVEELGGELDELAQIFLRSKFRDVKEMKVSNVKRSSTQGAFVYEISGTAMASPDQGRPREFHHFSCRIGISRDGKVTDCTGNAWTT